MAKAAFMAYLPGKSFVHRLTGTTKLSAFGLFSLAAMITYDTRVLLVLLFIGIFCFMQGHLKWDAVKPIFIFMALFLMANTFFIYLFAPEQGVEIYGTRHLLFHIAGRYTITTEQLFYQFNVVLKYMVSIPMAVLFVSTTNPSEFAASLHSLGVSYRIGYAVSLALRYIPDVQRDYHEISQAQQARGVEMGKNVSVFKRAKNSAAILLPLVLSSLDRVEVIANAMELRGFGKHPTRTWYGKAPMRKSDYTTIAVFMLLFIASIAITYADGSRFYNPFV